MPPPSRIVCLGGAAVDRVYRLAGPAVAGTSNPATVGGSPGGVARNVAELLARLETPVSLVSVIGDDEGGRSLLADLAALGVDTAGTVAIAGAATAEYAAVTDPDGDLVIGVAAMAVLDRLDAALVTANTDRLRAADWVFADCNAAADGLAALIALRRGAGFRLAVDAVSTPKVRRLPADLAGVDVLFLNADEARALIGMGESEAMTAGPAALADAVLARGAGAVVLTLGADGALVTDSAGTVAVPAAPATIAEVTGAGDSLIAATLWRLAAGDELDAAVRFGSALAALTLEATGSVRRDLPREALAATVAARAASLPPNTRIA
ncbi:carbohydrate kinase family protein [Pseudoxanthobacter sp. M-2]|uniref:carbohydrate kinase family protein n=1 Tax=Pseudoxanthobacter sp. M-2 TaxID=3078754 RepID=UPI0038FD0097